MFWRWLEKLWKRFHPEDRLIQITGHIAHESKRALLFEYETRNGWLPKRKLKIIERTEDQATIELPFWLARKKFHY